MRRIGMLTSGGDCQALNATMRGVAKSLYNMFDDVEIIGFEDGYKGLMYADYQIINHQISQGFSPRAVPFSELLASLSSSCALLMRTDWIRWRP